MNWPPFRPDTLVALRSDGCSYDPRRERLERCRAERADPNHAGGSVAAIAVRRGFRTGRISPGRSGRPSA